MLMTVLPLKLTKPVVSVRVSFATDKSWKAVLFALTTVRPERGVKPPIAVPIRVAIFPVASKVRLCAPLILPILMLRFCCPPAVFMETSPVRLMAT